MGALDRSLSAGRNEPLVRVIFLPSIAVIVNQKKTMLLVLFYYE